MSLGPDDDDRESDRRSAIVVVCLCDRFVDALAPTLASVLTHTDADVPVIVANGGEAARLIVAAAIQRPGSRAVRWLDSANSTVLARELASSDIAIVRPPCRVANGWLDGLRAVAESDAALSVVAALDERAGSSAPEDPAGGGGFEVRAAARAAKGPGLAARIPAHDPPCCLIRRSAIELVGTGDLGAGFIRRAERSGLASVVAENVLVAGGAALPLGDAAPALARVVSSARRAREGVAVIVDARCLSGSRDGTRTHVLGLLGALARRPDIRLTALVPQDIDTETARDLAAGSAYRQVSVPTGGPIPAGLRADLVHRPYQIAAHADLAALGRLADRLVVTHQDLISFHQRDYFPSAEAWLGYRAMTRDALSAADQVVFFSHHVQADAIAADLVEANRASVVPLGVDDPDSGSKRAAGAADVQLDATPAPGAETILCLGTDFTHKNRVFALRVVQALQREHGWDGQLVLAGPHIRWGSSRDAEARELATDARLRAAVSELGEVSSVTRAQLLAGAALVLYPTVHEGFGLIPFEAAAHGRPSLWAPASALAELLPVAAAGIVPWDASATAGAALALMRDPGRRRVNVRAVSDAAATLTWERAARTLAELYVAVCDRTPAPVAQLQRERGLVGAMLSEDAVRLVGPGGALPPELERPVLALATHRRLARPLFAALRVGYRLARRVGAVSPPDLPEPTVVSDARSGGCAEDR